MFGQSHLDARIRAASEWVIEFNCTVYMNSHSHFLRPDEIPKVTFYCPRKEGAVLCFPVPAKVENTVASADFGKWIIRHIDCWFVWARQLGLGVDRMEDIVLVTGAHCTRSYHLALLSHSLAARTMHRYHTGQLER